MFFGNARSESAAAGDFIIVTCIARPASDETKWNVSSIHDAMGDVAGNVMQAPSCHVFKPAVTRAVAQDQFAATGDRAIELRAIGDGVPVPVGHEVFITDPAGLNFGSSPEQTALGAGGDGFPPPHSIDYCFRIKLLPGLLVVKNSFKLSELLFGRAEPRHL